MKKIDFEVIVFVFFSALFVGFFAIVGLWYMTTKNMICKDFGQILYQRELTWIECVVL